MVEIITEYMKEENKRAVPSAENYLRSIENMSLDEQIKSIRNHLINLKTEHPKEYIE